MFLAEFEVRYTALNIQQKEAVDEIEGPVLVVAGPGTGKTQLLAMRVANILQKTDTSPNSILCLTFTDSAAQNMRTRLRNIIGTDAQKVAIHTFHSLGTEIINQNPEYFYKGARYEAADELAKISIIENILLDLNDEDPLKSYHPDFGWTYKTDILARITDLKQAGLTPADYLAILEENIEVINMIDSAFNEFNNVSRIDQIKPEKFENFLSICANLMANHVSKTRVLDSSKLNNIVPWSELFMASLVQLSDELDIKWDSKPLKNWRDIWGKKDDFGQWHIKDWLNTIKQVSFAHIYEAYQAKLHSSGLFDFDDMLIDVVEAFHTHPSLGYKYQEKFLYMMVDEFQDTNGVQMTLIDSLINLEVNEGRPNLLAVGDDDQGIYKFQRATIENILNFKQKYLDVNIITLTENYRSTQDILDLAQYVIELSESRLADLPEITKLLRSNRN